MLWETSCEHRGSRGRANRGSRVKLSEADALFGQLIQVWRVKVFGSIAVEIDRALIIRVDQDHIGFSVGGRCGSADEKNQQDCETVVEMVHGAIIVNRSSPGNRIQSGIEGRACRETTRKEHRLADSESRHDSGKVQDQKDAHLG